jgi:Na+-translocating ferredoxin:NAD+ oxidoreductase subunit G
MATDDKNSIFKVAFNLIAACFISGCVIGVVYFITAPVAAQKAEIMKQESMKSLVQDADSFKEVPGKDKWFEAQKSGQTIAYVVPGESKGYGGKIKMLVAVTPDGKVIDYTILEHNETPGLGDNASKPAFREQFKDRTSEQLVVVKDKSKKDNIQAMTGATISSRAVTKGVKESVDEVVAFTGGKK